MLKLIKHLCAKEARAGVLLLSFSLLAIICKNYTNFYPDFKNSPYLDLLINEGLMSLFFFQIGLELREHAQDLSEQSLALAGALGGILIPALIFLSCGPKDLKAAWAVPTATDIALALTWVNLCGKFFPHKLKMILLNLAIFDDLAAIFIIALFYTHSLNWYFLSLSLGIILSLYLLKIKKRAHNLQALLLSIALWLSLLKAQIHPSLAGVVLAFSLQTLPKASIKLKINQIITYLVLPSFAFANTGIALSDLQYFNTKLSLSIALSLALGKPLGIMLFSFSLIYLKLLKLPQGISSLEFFLLSTIAGLGFSMSLLIASLVPTTAVFKTQLNIGIILGSSLAIALSLIIILILKYQAKLFKP